MLGSRVKDERIPRTCLLVETLPDKGNELVIELLATPTSALRSKVLFDTMTQAMNQRILASPCCRLWSTPSLKRWKA